MKSSARILAIALALAFLLLARATFIGGGAVSAETIELEDGEAAFAQNATSKAEAEYVGLGADGETNTVYFYVQSDALGTTVTASTTGALDGSSALLLNGQAVTFIGGNVQPSRVAEVDLNNDGNPVTDITAFTVPGAPGNNVNVLIVALTGAYCNKLDTTVVAYTDEDGYSQPADATTTISVSGFGVRDANGTDGPANGNCASVSPRTSDERAVLTQVQQQAFAENALHALNQAEIPNAINQNRLLYTYKDGSKYVTYDKVNPARRYTHGQQVGDADADGSVGATEFNWDIVGGSMRPLLPATGGIAGTRVMTDANTSASDGLFAVVSNATGNSASPSPTGGSFQVISPTDLNASNVLSVQATYDIVDVYEKADGNDAGTSYPDYTSGYARALVTSPSDTSGEWVTIREVTGVAATSSAPDSNLFYGAVTITNDPGEEAGVYVQDGDTLTLRVLSKNGDRDSADITTATVIVDDAKPAVSGLSPANNSILSDNTANIGFTINDSGAGLDVKDPRNVVQSIYLHKRDSDGKSMGDGCMLVDVTKEDKDDTSAGVNKVSYPSRGANQVSAVYAPTGENFSDNPCGSVVDTTTLGDNGHGVKFNIEITVQDLAGNQKTNTSALTIDTVKPAVQDDPSVDTDGVLAGKAWDADDNEPMNAKNSILIKFTESLDPDTVTASDFTVAGYTIASVEVVGANTDDDKFNNEYVVITLNEDLAQAASPSITLAADAVSDVAGNKSAKATRTAKNVIAPTVTVTPFSKLLGEKGEQGISFTSDEGLRSGSGTVCTCAAVSGPTGGSLSVSIDAGAQGGSATFKQATFKSTGAYGVLLRARDNDGNVTTKGADSVSNEDVTLDSAIAANASFKHKLANWPPVDKDFDGNVTDDISASVAGEDDDRVATKVDWATGEVTIAGGASIPLNTAVTVSYSHAAEGHIVQVDVTKPTLTSTPADGATTDYAGTVVQFHWDDDEYAGDTNKTVTLNSVMHKGPDGESADVTDMVNTTDDKRWTYAPEGGLALGKHEFTLTATDKAGNVAKGAKTSFTVEARKPVTIGLNPGWNLISFRGAPASLDINDIFTDQSVTVVSQYDGSRASAWTVWTRNDEGMLTSTPAGQTTIDPGLGLYVLSSDGQSLEVDIPGISREDPATLPPSINLIAGWNLVAVIIIDRDVNRVEADAYMPKGAWTRAFKLNDVGLLVSISPDKEGRVSDDYLNAGEGVWVYAVKTGVIVPK